MNPLHPDHYLNKPSGIEIIEVAKFMNFTCGNAMKYLSRYKQKNGVEDLKKALYYLKAEKTLPERFGATLSAPRFSEDFAQDYTPDEFTIFKYLWYYYFYCKDHRLDEAIDCLTNLITELEIEQQANLELTK